MRSDVNQAIPVVPKSQVMYGTTVHWFTVLSALITTVAPVIAMAMVGKNMLNPHFLFAALWTGKGPNEIWQEVGSGFPGGHFYLQNLSTGDGLALLGIAVCCSATLWALLPAVVQYVKEREYFFAGVCLFTAILITVSMIGVSGMLMPE